HQQERGGSSEDGHRRHADVLCWEGQSEWRSHKPEDDCRRGSLRRVQISHRRCAGVQNAVDHSQPSFSSTGEMRVRTLKPEVCSKICEHSRSDVSAVTSALLIFVFLVGATIQEALRDLWAVPETFVEALLWIGSRLRRARPLLLIFMAMLACAGWSQDHSESQSLIGKEVAIPRHLQDGEEYDLSIPKLIRFGESLFTAKWT